MKKIYTLLFFTMTSLSGRNACPNYSRLFYSCRRVSTMARLDVQILVTTANWGGQNLWFIYPDANASVSTHGQALVMHGLSWGAVSFTVTDS